MNRRTFFAAGVAVATAGLSGCWESTDVTVVEPGKYKGKPDPLLAQQAAARAEALQKRFQLVQVDR